MGANESEDYEMIQNEFREAGVIGKLLKLTIKSTPNKKIHIIPGATINLKKLNNLPQRTLKTHSKMQLLAWKLQMTICHLENKEELNDEY